MSKSIKISPKHGVNPGLIKCFWCGEDIGLALYGKLKGDVQAPNNVVASYEPCDKCKENFAKGILIMGVTDKQVGEGFPPIIVDNGEPFYLTGSHIVVKEDFIERILDDQALIDSIIEKKAAYFPNDLVERIIEDATNAMEEESQNEQCNCGVSSDNGDIPNKED